MTTAVTTNADVLLASDDLSEMILQSEVYHSYRNAKRAVQEDEGCRELLQAFMKKKEAYEEVQRFGKYHPDFHRVTAEIRELKRQVDTEPLIAAFKEAETELENLLNEISGFFANAVSPEIKVPSGNPFFDSGCSGGCGTGGSCGCG